MLTKQSLPPDLPNKVQLQHYSTNVTFTTTKRNAPSELPDKSDLEPFQAHLMLIATKRLRPHSKLPSKNIL
jgi:hypothetical protein